MVNRLVRERTQAVMIDMQERLLPAMERREQITERTALFLEGLKILGIPVTVTQQYTKGLGGTEPRLMGAGELADYVEKLSFSCLGETAFREALSADRECILLFGVETHICVQATALDLMNAGKKVFIVCDCVDSRHAADRELSLRRMEQAGAVLTTAEAALFELVGRAGCSEFKQISKLVK